MRKKILTKQEQNKLIKSLESETSACIAKEVKYHEYDFLVSYEVLKNHSKYVLIMTSILRDVEGVEDFTKNLSSVVLKSSDYEENLYKLFEIVANEMIDSIPSEKVEDACSSDCADNEIAEIDKCHSDTSDEIMNEPVLGEVENIADGGNVPAHESSDLSVPFTTLTDYSNIIAKSIDGIMGNTFKIALCLYAVRKNKLYQSVGFQNVYEFGKTRFDLARGTVANYVKIAENFSIEDKENKCFTIDSRLRGYSVAQLILLRGLTIEGIEANGFSWTMSCSEIKKKLSELNLHITKGGKFKALEERAKALTTDTTDDMDIDESYDSNDSYDIDDTEDNSEKSDSTSPVLQFSFMGGADVPATQLTILNKMCLKQTGHKFKILVYRED